MGSGASHSLPRKMKPMTHHVAGHGERLGGLTAWETVLPPVLGVPHSPCQGHRVPVCCETWWLSCTALTQAVPWLEPCSWDRAHPKTPLHSWDRVHSETPLHPHAAGSCSAQAFAKDTGAEEVFGQGSQHLLGLLWLSCIGSEVGHCSWVPSSLGYSAVL